LKIAKTELDGLLLVQPSVFRDERGYFFESWSRERYGQGGIETDFVQDNVSFSSRGVLRGMHFQNPVPQAKLVSVLQGAVFDVAVDLRRASPTFARWFGVELSAENNRQLYIPEGFAHGFVVLSDTAIFSYRCSGYYSPAQERSLRWDDPEIGIRWPVGEVMVSPRDADAPLLADIPEAHLFG